MNTESFEGRVWTQINEMDSESEKYFVIIGTGTATAKSNCDI